RVDAKYRRSATYNSASDRRRVEARCRASSRGLRLGLIDHDRNHIFRVVGRERSQESVEAGIVGVATVDDLVGGTCLPAHIVAGHFRTLARALLHIQTIEIADLGTGVGRDYLPRDLGSLFLGAGQERRRDELAPIDHGARSNSRLKW